MIYSVYYDGTIVKNKWSYQERYNDSRLSYVFHYANSKLTWLRYPDSNEERHLIETSGFLIVILSAAERIQTQPQ